MLESSWYKLTSQRWQFRRKHFGRGRQIYIYWADILVHGICHRPSSHSTIPTIPYIVLLHGKEKCPISTPEFTTKCDSKSQKHCQQRTFIFVSLTAIKWGSIRFDLYLSWTWPKSTLSGQLRWLKEWLLCVEDHS